MGCCIARPKEIEKLLCDRLLEDLEREGVKCICGHEHIGGIEETDSLSEDIGVEYEQLSTWPPFVRDEALPNDAAEFLTGSQLELLLSLRDSRTQRGMHCHAEERRIDVPHPVTRRCDFWLVNLVDISEPQTPLRLRGQNDLRRRKHLCQTSSKALP